MNVFVVVEEPYHENGEVVGVFSDLEQAKAACAPDPDAPPFLPDGSGWSIYEVEMDGPVVRWMSDAITGGDIEPLRIEPT